MRPDVRRAIDDLLAFSPDRAIAAERAVRWAVRLAGADTAFILDRDGRPLAELGMPSKHLVAATAAWLAEPDVAAFARSGVLDQPAVLLVLRMTGGDGLLAIGPGHSLTASARAGLQDYAAALATSLERIEMTERIRAVEQAKSQFLNLASHELRAPVAIMRGYIAMLERGTFGPLNEAGKHAAGVMSAKALEMHSLIEQMLEAARLEEGRLQPHLQPCDVRRVVVHSLDAMRPFADAAHPLVLSAPADPLVIAIDPERVQTILTNLIDNAIKYSPAGGPVECELRTTDDAVLISVRDHGIGIAPANAPRLFNRFGRITSEATQGIPGIGLGLYLARELARLHEGDLTFVSRPGAGSTFVLALPRSRQ
jgi:signal transduction histidine kinase